MILFETIDSNTGKSHLLPLPDHLLDLPSDEQSSTDAIDALRRQNVARWSVTRNSWNRAGSPLPPNTWEVIAYDSEHIAGDTYATAPNNCFVPMPAGCYNLKTLFEVEFSFGAYNIYRVIRINTGYRIRDSKGTVGAWIALGSEQAQYLPTNAWCRIGKASIAGADTCELSPSQYVQFGWSYEIDAGGVDATFYERFYARMVCERVKEMYSESKLCECL